MATDGDKDRPQNIVYFLTGQGIDPTNPANSKFDINRTTGEIYVLKVNNIFIMFIFDQIKNKIYDKIKRKKKLSIQCRISTMFLYNKIKGSFFYLFFFIFLLSILCKPSAEKVFKTNSLLVFFLFSLYNFVSFFSYYFFDKM